MKKEYLNSDTLFARRAFGSSQVVTSQGGKWVHFAGQTAWDKEVNIVIVGGADLLKQMQQSLENVRLALTAAADSLWPRPESVPPGD